MITITEKEFKLLAEYIQVNYGIQLKSEKQALLIGRLHNVLIEMGFSSFTQYYQYLVTDKNGDAVTILLDKITTNHTFFMREAEHFYFFRDYVLPQLARTIRDRDLRVWCAASSTGEEPYTLAMIINEFTDKVKLNWDTKILATDIASNVLELAKQGIYSNEKLAPLPKYWKLKYFKKYDNENSIINEQLKDEVIYRRFNLMENVFPFKKKFHVIFCRNVMIYFDNHTKDVLVQKLYDMLENGGYLFIGHSESLNRETSPFKYISPAVYRKI